MVAKNIATLSRPKNRSFEAYKSWIMSLTAALSGNPEKDDMTQEEWTELWKDFWGIKEKGGAGSGNYGHAGRPGEVGGSGEGDGGNAGSPRDSRPISTGGSLSSMPAYVQDEQSDYVNRPELVTERPFDYPNLHQPLTWDPDVKDGAIGKVQEAMDKIPSDLLKGMVMEVSLQSNRGKEIVVGGKDFNVAGNWDEYNKKINLFDVNDRVAKGKGFEDIINHEVGHAVFDSWYGIADKEDHESYTNHPEWWKMGNNVSDEYKNKYEKDYPLASARRDFIVAWKSGEDGITDYSSAWAKRGKPSETVAEMSKIYFTKGKDYLVAHCDKSKATKICSTFLKVLSYHSREL